MSNQEPKYIIKWLAGIAASVATALIIAYLVPSGEDSSPARLLTYDADRKSVSLVYPEFLKPAKTFLSESGIAVNIGPAEIGMFDRLFGDEAGRIRIQVGPHLFITSRNKSSSASGDSSTKRKDFFEDAETISRVIPDKAEFPIDTYTEVEKAGIYKVTRIIIHKEKGAYIAAYATAVFNEKTWDKHQDVIRKSMRSITVSKDNFVSLFERNGWTMLTNYKDEKGTSKWLCQKSLWSPKSLEATGCDLKSTDAIEMFGRLKCDGIEIILTRYSCDEVKVRAFTSD